MALTMTHTRTQAALTRLAALVANLHGELATVEQLIQERPEHAEALHARNRTLQADRDALYLTLKQFDPELEPANIGTSNEWMVAYGRRGSKIALQRYLAQYKK